MSSSLGQIPRSRIVAIALSALVLGIYALTCEEAGQLAESDLGALFAEGPAGLVVLEVDPGGPAQQAGLVADDVVRSMGGEPTTDFRSYDRARAGMLRGQPVALEVRRGQEQIATEIVPGGSVVWWRLALRGLLLLASLAVLNLSLFGRSSDLRARLLAMLFFLIAWEFALPEDGFRLYPALALASVISYYVTLGAQIAVELHLAASIPEPVPSRRWMINAFHAVGVAIAVTGTVTYIDDLTTRHLLPWNRHGFDELLNAAIYPLWALALVALLGIAAIRWPERRGRLQAGLVLLGALPWAAYIGVSWARGYPALPGLVDELVPLILLCYPVAVFVAIFRYEFLDLEAVVRRSLVYATLTGALVLAFYAALGAGGAVLLLVLGDGAGSIARVSLATVLLGVLFAPLRRAIQRSIDRRFFPERVRLRRRLIDLASELPALGTPERMGERLVRKLRPIFAVPSVSLYLVEPETAVLMKTAGSGPADDALPRKLALDDAAIALLGRKKKPVATGELVAAGTALAEGLRGLGAGVAVPFRAGDRLTGLLLLAEKTTRRRFNREELELLTLIAQQAGTAFDNARLYRRAAYEELTGLMRREQILDMLRGELERAVRYRRPLAVALVDIDHFKSVNDRFGHAEGDRVLREVAGCLSGLLRASDGVGRYGGEEFLCVFPETDRGAAAALAEKLRRAVEALALYTEDGKRIGVTVSIGLASLQDKATGPDLLRRLVATADAALYRAKGAGRNRVEGGDAIRDTPATR